MESSWGHELMERSWKAGGGLVARVHGLVPVALVRTTSLALVAPTTSWRLG